jgi:protein TonB
MDNLIAVKKICPPGQVMNNATGECVASNSRTLRDFLAEEAQAAEIRSSRKAIKKLDDANKPPPPPKLTATKKQIDLPKANISGAAPTEIKFDRVTNIDVGSVSVSDRDAQPIRPPSQGPLIRALQRIGKPAKCEVSLEVDVAGKPFNVNATCNIKAYERAAEQAVAKAEFAPKIVKGKAVGRKGVVYPIELNLAE